MDESQAGVKIARRNINSLIYADDTTLMAENKEKLKSFFLDEGDLESPMDGGAWWAAVQGVAEGRTRLSDFTFTFAFCHKGSVICISEIIDISPDNLDSSLYLISPAYKLNKQGDNI